MSIGNIFRLKRMNKKDLINIKKAEKRRERRFFKQLTSRVRWHDCSDGFICNADILEEHYRFASRAVKKCGIYLIGHRAFVPYDGNLPFGNSVERLAQAGDCVVYRFYDTKWRQDVAFRLSAERIPELDKMVDSYISQLRGNNDKQASCSR